MTGAAAQGWVFLIARGRETGYRLLLAPDFVVKGRDSGILVGAVQGEVPNESPPRIVSVVSPREGPLYIVYRTHRATRSDVDLTDQKDAPLLDGSGRPIVLTFGFVCRGVRVDHADEEDLRTAREVALDTYQRFHSTEKKFTSETSRPYSLRSTTSPVQEEAGSTASLVRPSSPKRNYGPLFLLLALTAFVLVALGTVALVFNRTPDVKVPGVVGLTRESAQQRLKEAKFEQIIFQFQSRGCQLGTVIAQLPKEGDIVDKHSEVTLTVCGRP